MESDWPTDIQSATRVQNALRTRVNIVDDFGSVRHIAGVDVSYDLQTNLTRAFIVVLDADNLKLVTESHAALPTAFPYVPGFLSFREVPVIIEAFKSLSVRPDLLMVDGQGIAHPRRFGIAAHLGVLLDLPVIGVAKSRLIGKHEELPMVQGSTATLMDKGEHIGTMLRSKAGCNPLFISPGHRVSQISALNWVLKCLKAYRLPEQTRLADRLSKQKETPVLL